MLQKFTTAFAAIAALAAIVGCVLLWSALNAAQETFRAALDENRQDRLAAEKLNRQDRLASEKANRELLAALTELKQLSQEAKDGNAASPDWNPLTVKLVKDGDGGPAEGFRAYISGALYSDEEVYVSKTTDAEGVANFGLVRPGQYSLTTSTPWNLARQSPITIEPGSVNELTIRVPGERLVEADVKLEVELPDDLQKRDVSAVVEVHGPIQGLDDSTAVYSSKSSDRREFQLSSKLPVKVLGGPPSLSFKEYAPYEVSGRPFRSSQMPLKPLLGYASIDEHDQAGREEAHPHRWITGKYSIQRITLLSPTGARPIREDYGTSHSYYIVDDAWVYGNQGFRMEEPPTFTPRPGEDNVWKITLPPEMIENARERLKKFDELQQEEREKKAGKA